MRFLIIFICFFAASSSNGGRKANTTSSKTFDIDSLKTKGNWSIHPTQVPEAWKSYLDPNTTEFWTEGSHKPDAGFVLFMQEMTLESAKLWLLRGEIKARYLERALVLTEQAQRELIRDGLIKDRYNVMQNTASQFNAFASVQKKGGKELLDLQIFFIFSATCPYCEAMAKELRTFPNVYPLQATGTTLHHWDGMPKSEFASQETLKWYAPDKAVPVLVVHNNKTKEAIVLKGRRTTEEVILAASQLLGRRIESKVGGSK